MTPPPPWRISGIVCLLIKNTEPRLTASTWFQACSLNSHPEVVEGNPLAEHGPPTTVTAAELEDGVLVELDERWVVIESIEADLFKGSDYMLAWRSVEVDSDEEGTVILPGDSQLRSRSLDDVEDDSE